MIPPVTRAGKATAAALTDEDVEHVRGEVAAGRPAAVWFTAAAVGVPAGGSAKVVAVGDAADGEFIQVRQAGSRDTMFCSPQELTRTRPARKRAETAGKPAAPPPDRPKPAAGSPPPVPPPGRPRQAAAPVAPAPVTAGPAVPVRATRVRAAAAPVAPVPAPAASPPAADVPAVPAAAPATPAARSAGSRRRGAADAEGMSVHLTATAEGEWSVEVLAGRTRVVPPTPVPAAAVAGAARSLPPAVAGAIESALERARERQRERVERLRAELDAAQQMLDQFDP